jgi:hypothetical protein
MIRGLGASVYRTGSYIGRQTFRLATLIFTWVALALALLLEMVWRWWIPSQPPFGGAN